MANNSEVFVEFELSSFVRNRIVIITIKSSFSFSLHQTICGEEGKLESVNISKPGVPDVPVEPHDEPPSSIPQSNET